MAEMFGPIFLPSTGGGGGGSGTVTSVGVDSTLQIVSGSPTVNPTLGLSAAEISLIASKAPLVSPALTGSPTAPTQSPGDNTTKIATDAFVAAAITAASGLGPDVVNGLLQPTANVEQVIRNQSIDQMAPPAADWNGNGKRLFNLARPAFQTDAAQANYALLGKSIIAASHAYSTTSATMAAIDTTNMTTPSFTAISTQVLVYCFAQNVANSTGTGTQSWTLFTHGTTTQLTSVLHAYAKGGTTAALDGNPAAVPAWFYVTGLTIGTAYQFDWAWGTTAGTANISTGGNSTGAAQTTDLGIAIMEVYAA